MCNDAHFVGPNGLDIFLGLRSRINNIAIA